VKRVWDWRRRKENKEEDGGEVDEGIKKDE